MVDAVVISTCSVVPAEPTPVGRLSLSEFDQPRHLTLTSLLSVYKPNKSISASSLIRTITISLSRALVPFYPLAGRLRWIGGGRLEIHCNAAGAQLVVAETTSRLDELTDFEPSAKIENLLPKVDYTSPIHTMPLVSVVITKFACGGFTLGVGTSHAVVDGSSSSNFGSAWFKLARGETLERHDMPSYDRFVVGAAHAPPCFDHVEYRPLPLLIGRSDSREEEAKETSISMLKLTKSQVAKLKKRANSEIEIENRPYSTYETVTAHIWRCACKARNGLTGQRTVIRVIVDCRGRLKPPLPKNYAGNAIFFTITDPSCVMGDLVEKPLSYAAGKIREAVESFTYEYIISALNLIASQEDVGRLIRKGSSNGRQFLGNPNLLVTSWINVPIYEGDFGWGRPIHVRPGPGALDTDGKCFIIPSNDGDGSLVVFLRLQTQHMAVFKKWFYQDIDSISCKL